MTASIVAVFGANGAVGSSVVKHLIPKHKQGDVKLVIVSRPGSAISSAIQEAGVPVRTIDLENDSETELAKKLEGINVLVSAISGAGMGNQMTLLKALAKVSGFKVFIPSAYSRPFNPEELEHPSFKPLADVFFAPHRQGKELGVGITAVHTGIFDDWYFKLGYMGADLSANVVTANEQQKKNKLGMVTMDYLGAAIAQLVSQDPATIANKEYTAIDLWPTGQEIIDVVTKINGSTPEIKGYTKEDYDRGLEKGGMETVREGYMIHWQDADLNYPERVVVPGYNAKSLEEVARVYKQ